MAQDDGQERTEEPTPKRQQESRQKGQIPRSRELTTLIVMLMGGAGLYMFGPAIMEQLMDQFKHSFQLERKEIFDTALMLIRLRDLVIDGMLLLTPFFLLVIFAALISPMALGGWSFSVSAMAPKPEKLDPIKGLGRIFGWKGLMELFKAVGKFLLLATVGWLLLWHYLDQFMALGYEPINQGLAHFAEIIAWCFLILTASMVAIAAIDVPFQLWDHNRQIKMTRQEVKDEFKETDGNPEMKGKMRQVQQEIAQRRMMTEVPKADVVITNPTHFAVALVYDQSGNGAPTVVASGADLIALKIRSVATESHVPVVEAPPLARALYYSTELGDEIPAGLYLAVAKILAYVYQIQVYQGQGGAKPAEPKDDDLPIPDDLKRDE